MTHPSVRHAVVIGGSLAGLCTARGGVLYPIEDGRWMATLGGLGEDRPPTDEAGFLECAAETESTLTPYRGCLAASPSVRLSGLLVRLRIAPGWPAAVA